MAKLAGDITVAPNKSGATLQGNKFYIFGGMLASQESFNPRELIWTPPPDLLGFSDTICVSEKINTFHESKPGMCLNSAIHCYMECTASFLTAWGVRDSQGMQEN